MLKSEHPILVDRSFHISVEKLWEVITDLDHMHQWFFEEIKEFKAEPGFQTSFDIHSDTRTFPHVWNVKEVIPNYKLVVTWNYTGYAGECDISFETFSEDTGSSILLTAIVLEDFPNDIPEFKRESAVGGWDYFINDRLANYVASL